MQLSKPLAELLAPLFKALPVEEAMPELVPGKPGRPDAVEIVKGLAKEPIIQANPPLQAALWLYVDELGRSHEISQSIETPVGSLWHGIMHRREGDFWNSKYWFRRASGIPVSAGMNPSDFVDRVEQTYKNNPSELLEYQRKEWVTMFEWSASQIKGEGK